MTIFQLNSRPMVTLFRSINQAFSNVGKLDHLYPHPKPYYVCKYLCFFVRSVSTNKKKSIKPSKTKRDEGPKRMRRWSSVHTAVYRERRRICYRNYTAWSYVLIQHKHVLMWIQIFWGTTSYKWQQMLRFRSFQWSWLGFRLRPPRSFICNNPFK